MRLVAFKHPYWSGRLLFDEASGIALRVLGIWYGKRLRARIVGRRDVWTFDGEHYSVDGYGLPPWVRVTG